MNGGKDMSAFDAWADTEGVTHECPHIWQLERAFEAGIEHERRQQWRAASLKSLQRKLLCTTDGNMKLEYVPANKTDIRATFERAREAMKGQL